MNWKFWKKETPRESSAGTMEVKLARPKELPDHVGRLLVTRLNLDPDWVWNLKCAMHPIADEKNVFRIRIFNPETAAGKSVIVANYNSLDAHPDMILFSGIFDKKTGKVQLDEKLEQVA